MPRNQSEKLPAGAERLNQKQLDHMRNEGLYSLKAISQQVQQASWDLLSGSEQDELCFGDTGAVADTLRTFYKEQHRAKKSK